MFDQIVDGARNVVQLCSNQESAPRLLFTSSGAVYGELPEHLSAWPEESLLAAPTLDPRCAYANGKRAAEVIFALAGSEGFCRPTIARLFSFSGRHLPLDRHFAIGNFIRDAIAGGPIRIRGTGQDIRSYLDGDDLADILLSLIDVQRPPYTLVHVGEPQRITIDSLATLVADVAESLFTVRPIILTARAPSPLDGYTRYVPEVTMLARNNSFRGRKSLCESITEMFIANLQFLDDDRT